MRTLRVLVCALMLAPLTLSADVLATYYFQASLSPSAETPDPITDSMASGSSLVRIHVRRSDAGDLVQAVVDFDTTLTVVQEQNLTNMHIHVGALGVGGGVVIDSHFNQGTPGLTIPVEAGGTARIIRQAVVEPGDAKGVDAVEAILSGDTEGYYVNVHSSSHPGGLARGQLHPVDLTAVMDAAAKVDAAQASIAALQAQIDAMQDLLTRIALRFSINP
jgi:CHRD domain